MRARSFPLDPVPIPCPARCLTTCGAAGRHQVAAETPATRTAATACAADTCRELVAYWAEGYDWRAAERAINAYEHYRADVGGVPVHFMRKPGAGPGPSR